MYDAGINDFWESGSLSASDNLAHMDNVAGSQCV